MADILTDAEGRPVERPARADYPADLDYVQAVHQWRDRVVALGNDAFNGAFCDCLLRLRRAAEGAGRSAPSGGGSSGARPPRRRRQG